MAKKKKSRCGKAAVAVKRKGNTVKAIRYRCEECGVEEDIPMSVIDFLEIFEDGDLPEFKCKKCKGIMGSAEKEEFKDAIYITHEQGEETDDEWF